MTKSITLADALPIEIERCKKLIKIYDEIGPVGVFGKTMIQKDIDYAEKTTREGDTVGMLKAYYKLQDCE